MITKFKIFENISEGVPEVGDYVIIKNVYDKIYKILEYDPNRDKNYPYIIDMPSNYYKSKIVYCSAGLQNIEYWSKNKEDLKSILDIINNMNKFNV